MNRLAGACALALALAAAKAGAAAAQSWRARPSLIPVGGIVLFYDTKGPLSSNLATRRELPDGAVPVQEVTGKACQHGLSIPLSVSLRPTNVSGAKGDGGYRKALERIREDHPGLRGLYDVKVDQHVITVLGIYRRLCAEVTARGFK